MSLTLLTYQILEIDKTSKKKRVALTIKNSLEVCKIVKNNVLKSFIIKQFIIGSRLCTTFWKLKKSVKRKRGILLFIMHCTIYSSYIILWKKYFLYLSWKKLIRACFQKNLAQHVRISTVFILLSKMKLLIDLNINLKHNFFVSIIVISPDTWHYV